MVEMKAKSAFCAVAMAFLAACGGGGSGGPITVTNADPQGIWQGTSNSGQAVSTLVLETGQYFAVYSTNNVVGGMVEGTLSVSGNSITDNSASDFVVGGPGLAAIVTGTVTTKQLLSATVKESAKTVTFNGAYDAAYDSSPSLSQAVGTWTGSSAGSPDITSITVAADSTFTGTSGSCTFSGSVKPRATGKNVLDGTVTFKSSACALGNGTSIEFESFFSGSQMIAAGVDSSRMGGFVFVGTKS
ncbi:hypothetical protein PWR66_05430 [Paraburkholderia sp. A1RO-5]|uniref:hypothetical protein n=1 Tax=Paraburkholderia sp. A1RO-5 TaxID=3028369 RepID=UPI003B7CD3D2